MTHRCGDRFSARWISELHLLVGRQSLDAAADDAFTVLQAPADVGLVRILVDHFELAHLQQMGGGWIVDVTATLPDNGGVASETFELFVEAVSSDSIINRSDDEGEAMDMDDHEMNMTEEPEGESESG